MFDGRELTAHARYSGFGTFVRQLVEALARRPDLEVALLATDDLPLPPGVERVALQRFVSERWFASMEHAGRVWFDLRRARGDVFHNPVAWAPRHLERPWVQSLHDVIPLVRDDPDLARPRQMWRAFGPRYRRADRIAAISRFSADEGIRVLGLDPARVEVIHHGVGPEFRPGPPDGGADGPPYVAVVSEFSQRKGYAEAFALVAALADAGLPHRLRVAGRVNPRRRAELDALVAAAPRPDRIDVVGFVADLPGLLRGAEVVVVPSRYEGFGLPALEAMACGRPVVAFDNSSLPEIVGDGGLLVPDGDVPALAAAVRSVLTEPALATELVERATTRAAAFDWDRAAGQYADLYRDALAR